MKKYEVEYFIKANNTKTKHTEVVEAKNAAEACALVKKAVKSRTNRNAFTPAAHQIKED